MAVNRVPRRNPARNALFLGISAAVAAQAAPVAAQDAQNQGPDTQRLGTVVVTGSRIRRVDLETANPVVTIDKAAIERSGKLTVGDLLQNLPSVAGAGSNPSVNNSGGDGGTYIDLRGLGAQRTLILINGHRIMQIPGNSTDVNQIPASAIERMEVLGDGASSVYGSDAIGGVVNFVLRSDFQGVELQADYGISDRDDGQRQGYSVMFGHNSEKGNLTVGVNYNKQEIASAANRPFSADAFYLYSGVVSLAGSSRTPSGRIFVPDGMYFNQDGESCGSVTLIAGRSGGSPGDYRCYVGSGPNNDAYNYQRVGNLILTPQERTSAFALGNYKITDSVTGYLEVYANKTRSRSQIAPLPFDAQNDAVTIAADNYYNPFGIEFGRDGYQYLSRFTSLGNRVIAQSTESYSGHGGFKGTFGASSWTWDLGFDYGHYSKDTNSYGYVNYPALRNALGSSFLGGDGQVHCGTAENPIEGCTPINIFNVNDPATISQLQSVLVNPKYDSTTASQRIARFDVAGELFDLPAGAVSLAGGVSYRKDSLTGRVDSLSVADNRGNCALAQEACGSPVSGSLDVKEAYFEVLVPILKDIPFAHSLNLIVGDRYSKFDKFGNTNNWKVAVEWRPIEDLLLRGTVSKVFRAPTTQDVYAGPAGNAPLFRDPCNGLNAANFEGGVVPPSVAAACVGVPQDGSFGGTGLSQSNGTPSGNIWAHRIDPNLTTLKPEFGKSFNFGVVYDPRWLEGLSLSADLWRLYLNDYIGNIGASLAVNTCYNTGQFCSLVRRFPDGPSSGSIDTIYQPVVNLGRFDAKGVDFSAKYRLPETSFGSFALSFNSTYLARMDNSLTPGLPGNVVNSLAGKYWNEYGNYARWKAIAGISWRLGAFDASWYAHYVGPFSVGSMDLRQNFSADGSPDFPGVVLKYGSSTTHNFQIGYELASLKTRFDVGIDNAFDKKPPQIYQNNTLNSNTDVSTYYSEMLGRYFWGRVTVKF
ncbi:TonB-dependent receptor plug domain-containing protein [Dokdonella ginsengisoli]|uniref:TonB-dependent receptor plug domain-containing protein n=1 Tax=Dokdonella ginsengisoli TaxID=363846 RepID=A0ABV9QVI8_9GAMM